MQKLGVFNLKAFTLVMLFSVSFNKSLSLKRKLKLKTKKSMYTISGVGDGTISSHLPEFVLSAEPNMCTKFSPSIFSVNEWNNDYKIQYSKKKKFTKDDTHRHTILETILYLTDTELN